MNAYHERGRVWVDLEADRDVRPVSLTLPQAIRFRADLLRAIDEMIMHALAGHPI